MTDAWSERLLAGFAGTLVVGAMGWAFVHCNGGYAHVVIQEAGAHASGLRFCDPEPYLSLSYAVEPETDDDLPPPEPVVSTAPLATTAGATGALDDDEPQADRLRRRDEPSYRATTEIIYLPDTEHCHTLETAGVGEMSVEAVIADGWRLTGLTISSNTDAAAAPQAATTALTSILGALAPNTGGTSTAQREALATPGLYPLRDCAGHWAVDWEHDVVTFGCPPGLTCERPAAVACGSSE
jgi:hypothetical protein